MQKSLPFQNNLSEKQIETIFSMINDSVVVISNNFKIRYLNKKAEEIFGKNQLGKKCYEVLLNNDKICEDCSFLKILDKSNFELIKEISVEYSEPEKRSSYINTQSSIIDSNGEPLVIEIFQDVTKKNEYEQYLHYSVQKFKKLYENFPHPIFIINPNNTINDCNINAEIYTSEKKASLVTKDFFQLFPNSDLRLDYVNELVSNIVNFDLNEILEIEFVNSNGQKAWVEIFLSPIKNGMEKFVQIILQDITERKLVEGIVKRENRKLRELNEVKNQLMKQTTEDLKSPLDLVIESTNILLNSTSGENREYLRLIKQGSKKIFDMLNKIIDIANLDKVTLNIDCEIASLNDLMQNLKDEILIELDNQSFKIEIESPKELYSNIDGIRLKQIIKQLLSKLGDTSFSTKQIQIAIAESGNNAEIAFKILGNNNYNLTDLEEIRIFSKIAKLHKGDLIISESMEKKASKDVKLVLPLSNWRDLLDKMYIIYKSGIPLHVHSFGDDKSKYDPSLVTGGIIGTLNMLKSIIQGDKHIKTIDHGDNKIMFETNSTKDVIFVLIVKDDLSLFSRCLNTLVEKFDRNYQKLISNIEETHMDNTKWINLQFLIEKSFTI